MMYPTLLLTSPESSPLMLTIASGGSVALCPLESKVTWLLPAPHRLPGSLHPYPTLAEFQTRGSEGTEVACSEVLLYVAQG